MKKKLTLLTILLIGLAHGVQAGFFHMPENSTLTKITPEESDQLAKICGRSTDKRRYPWAVSLALHGFNKLGAAIISPYHILTVAHGFLRFDNSKPGACVIINYKEFPTVVMKRVMFGSDCIHFARTPTSPIPRCKEKNLQVRFIRSAAIDHGFSEGACVQGHDWAIIEVDKPFRFDDNVAPICLPRRRQHPIQPVLTAISWGRPSAFNESDPIVREIPMIHDPTCRTPWGDEMPSKVPDYLCAKSLNPSDYTSKRTCHGDSGSGLQQTDQNGVSTLMGITSFGSPGCPANELARFTRVAEYLDEICARTGVCYMQQTKRRRKVKI